MSDISVMGLAKRIFRLLGQCGPLFWRLCLNLPLDVGGRAVQMTGRLAVVFTFPGSVAALHEYAGLRAGLPPTNKHICRK